MIPAASTSDKGAWVGAGSAASGVGQQPDMFGGLSLEAPAARPSQSGLDALMGLGSPAAPLQSPAAAASADLFGGLSVGSKRIFHGDCFLCVVMWISTNAIVSALVADQSVLLGTCM